MPFGDGTGPLEQGPGTGRGRGFGRGWMPVRRSFSGGGGGNRPGAGPGGYCGCPNCRARVTHQVGVSCYFVNCPQNTEQRWPGDNII